jgi:NADH dehydrogenase
MKIDTVCLIGGSGFLGQHIAHLLAQRGVRARIATRHRDRVKQELIILPTVDVIESDVHEPATLSRLFSGCNAVVSLAGILHEHRPGDFAKVHTELPRRIVDACRANDVRRLLHVSALKAAHDAPSEYLRSKAGGEQQIRLAEAAAIHTTIFRPSVIFGRGDSFLNLFARLLRWLPAVALACPNARFQPIWVEDVARAIVESLAKSSTYSASYDLCGPRTYRLQELVEYVGRITGRRRPIIGLNNRLSNLQAWAMEWLPTKLMTRDNIASMQVDNVCDCAFPAVLGYEPTPLESVAPAYLGDHVPKARLDQLRLRARR